MTKTFDYKKNELLKNLEPSLDFPIVFKDDFKHILLVYVPIIKEKLWSEK